MSSIPSAFSVSAAYNADALRGGPAKLELDVQFDDAQARTGAASFNGYESVFALLPRNTANGLTWDRVDLSYVGTADRRGRNLDTHRGASLNVDLAAISQHGFAVGADTNAGTIWAQSGGGGNYTAHPSLLVEI